MREEVKRFAEEMEEKLARNDWKVSWKGIPVSVLISSMKGEVAELDSWVDRYHDGDRAEMLAGMAEECVDIANFAMMIRDNIERELQAAAPGATGQ